MFFWRFNVQRHARHFGNSYIDRFMGAYFKQRPSMVGRWYMVIQPLKVGAFKLTKNSLPSPSGDLFLSRQDERVVSETPRFFVSTIFLCVKCLGQTKKQTQVLHICLKKQLEISLNNFDIDLVLPKICAF